MARYIDADNLCMTDFEIATCDGSYKKAFVLLSDIIANAPTADVVEVVRCKDCKWFNDFGCAIRIVDESDKPKEDDFCSFGERRDDGD